MFDSDALAAIVTAMQTDASALLLTFFSLAIVVGIAIAIVRATLKGVNDAFDELNNLNQDK